MTLLEPNLLEWNDSRALYLVCFPACATALDTCSTYSSWPRTFDTIFKRHIRSFYTFGHILFDVFCLQPRRPFSQLFFNDCNIRRFIIIISSKIPSTVLFQVSMLLSSLTLMRRFGYSLSSQNLDLLIVNLLNYSLILKLHLIWELIGN